MPDFWNKMKAAGMNIGEVVVGKRMGHGSMTDSILLHTVSLRAIGMSGPLPCSKKYLGAKYMGYAHLQMQFLARNNLASQHMDHLIIEQMVSALQNEFEVVMRADK